MEIIERISDLLAERDKTAVELCKALDIQTSTMSTWKTRKKDPPARYMPAIANFLCVSLEYLLTGQERPAIIEQPADQSPKLSAMEEELLVRGICVYLLKDENNYIRYLVPNILFAAMHLFSYTNWGKITLVYVFSFITSQMLGLILTGCIFQYLKEKSGTIWIPVLVHAILDYMVVLGY